MSEIPLWRRHGSIAVVLSLALQLSGCTVWLHRTNVAETWREVQVIRERVAGEPERRVVPHADGLGWTVEVREPIEQTMARTGVRTWQGRQARILPGASWFVAIIGCPIALSGIVVVNSFVAVASVLLAKEATVGRYVLSEFPYMCLYPMIGILPEPLDRFGAETIVERDHTETGWRPITQGAVGIRLIGRDWIRYPVDESGRVSLRMEQLPVPVTPSEQEPVELSLWVRDKQIAEWTERIEPVAWQRLKEEPVIPAERWPKRLAVGLLPWQGLPEASRERWERRLLDELTRVTLERGGQLVPLLPAARQAIEAEIARQYSGGVADETQVSLGRKAGATVLVRPVARAGEARMLIGADVLAVETGEILASAGWEVPSAALESAAEAVVARVGRTVGQAPRR